MELKTLKTLNTLETYNEDNIKNNLKAHYLDEKDTILLIYRNGERLYGIEGNINEEHFIVLYLPANDKSLHDNTETEEVVSVVKNGVNYYVNFISLQHYLKELVYFGGFRVLESLFAINHSGKGLIYKHSKTNYLYLNRFKFIVRNTHFKDTYTDIMELASPDSVFMQNDSYKKKVIDSTMEVLMLEELLKTKTIKFPLAYSDRINDLIKTPANEIDFDTHYNFFKEKYKEISNVELYEWMKDEYDYQDLLDTIKYFYQEL
jgi:hypothetical protein